MPDDVKPNDFNSGAGTVGGYALGDRIGANGPFEAYEARKAGSDETLTIKIVPFSALTDQIAAYFSSIKDKVLGLDHINIGRCLDFGRDDERSCHYWVMEHLDGQTLHERTKERGSLPENELIGIGRHMSAVLDVLYGNGLVHRGIEPSRIVLCSSGYAKLADVGIADLCAGGEPTDSIRFAPPEQASGSRDLDVRSDIYALGASLYYMATGRAPFEEIEAPSVSAAMADGQIPWPADVNPKISARFSRVIAKMMAKDPAERYKTPTELTLDFGIVAESQEPVIAANTPSRTMIASATKPPVLEPGRPPTTTTKRIATVSASGRQIAAEPAADDEGEELPQRTSPDIRLLAAVGGGLIAAIIGIALILVSGSGGRGGGVADEPLSVPELEPGHELAVPVSPNSEPGEEEPRGIDREAEAEALFAAALKYVSENPEDFEGGLLRWKPVIVEAKGTAVEERAAAKIEELEAQWNERALKALEELQGRAEALASSGDIDGAFAILAELDQRLSKRVPERVESSSTRIAKLGADGVQGVLDRVQAQIKDGRLDEARASLGSLDSIRYEQGLAAVAPRRAALLAEIGELEKEALSAADLEARKGLSSLIKEYDSKIAGGDVAGAAALMASNVGKPELASVAAHLTYASDVAKELVDRQSSILAAAREVTGEKVSYATSKGSRRGVLESVDDAGLNLVTRVIINGQVRGETKHSIPWDELVPEEQERLAKSWRPKGDVGRVAQAVVALQQGDTEAAGKHLRVVADNPLVAHYKGKLALRESGAAEATAMEAWNEIERQASAGRLSVADGKALTALIVSFEAEHGKTEFAKSKAGEIVDVTARADAASSGVASGKKVRVVLSPSDDTYLDAAKVSINCGRLPSFKTTLGTPILLRFDHTGVPKNAKVAKATMSLFVLDGTPQDSKGAHIAAHAILKGNVGWKEGSMKGKVASYGDCNYNFRVVGGRGLRWAGGAFKKPGVDFAESAMGQLPLPLSPGKRYEMELDVAVVQEWASDPSSSHGLALMTATGYHPRFSSKEDAVTSRHPMLVLELVVGATDAPAAAVEKKAEPGPVPTDLRNLVKDGQWAPAKWAASATTSKRDHKGKPALAVEVPAGEETGKGAVACTCAVDLTGKSRISISATNLEKENVSAAIALVGSKGYYESRPSVLRSGRLGRISVVLKSDDFKCESSGWEFGAHLAGQEKVTEVFIVIYNGNRPARLLVTGAAVD